MKQKFILKKIVLAKAGIHRQYWGKSGWIDSYDKAKVFTSEDEAVKDCKELDASVVICSVEDEADIPTAWTYKEPEKKAVKPKKEKDD